MFTESLESVHKRRSQVEECVTECDSRRKGVSRLVWRPHLDAIKKKSIFTGFLWTARPAPYNLLAIMF